MNELGIFRDVTVDSREANWSALEFFKFNGRKYDPSALFAKIRAGKKRGLTLLYCRNRAIK